VCGGGGTPVCPVGTVTADVTVRQASATTNFGTQTPLELDGDSNQVQRAYFRVHVDSPGGQPITNAQLRLHVTDTSGSNSSSGGAIHSTLCEWSDSTLTWNTQATPPFDTATLSTVGTAARNAFVNFNVSSAITNGGDHCFVIEPGSTDNVRYDSIEFATAASKPQVLLTSQCACGTPPPVGKIAWRNGRIRSRTISLIGKWFSARMPETTASATLGPTPLTVRSWTKS